MSTSLNRRTWLSKSYTPLIENSRLGVRLEKLRFGVIPKKVGHFKCACLPRPRSGPGPVGRDCGLRLPHIKSKLSQEEEVFGVRLEKLRFGFIHKKVGLID